MSGYPHTIENGAGEQLTFLRLASDSEGMYLEVENRVQPGSGPPMHVHHLQEEGLTVRQGRMGYQRPGQEPCYAEEGESIVFGPGEAHRFWNAGRTELHCTGYVRPPDNLEYFLSAIYASQKQNGGGQPSPFDGAFLLRRYGSEFAMPEIPGFVQRFIFPVQIAIGRVLGRYGKYSDAPEPVRR